MINAIDSDHTIEIFFGMYSDGKEGGSDGKEGTKDGGWERLNIPTHFNEVKNVDYKF